jgi:hypothetical protein
MGNDDPQTVALRQQPAILDLQQLLTQIQQARAVIEIRRKDVSVP